MLSKKEQIQYSFHKTKLKLKYKFSILKWNQRHCIIFSNYLIVAQATNSNINLQIEIIHFIVHRKGI